MKSQSNNPLGFFNGPMLPANCVQRAIQKWKAPNAFVIPMNLEHGGWTMKTQTDRRLKRYVLAERCGLCVKIDENTGKSEKAKWVLRTGETLYGEHPIQEVDFSDVDLQILQPNSSTDLNLSSPQRVGTAFAAGVGTWWATAEHLPWLGEVVLCGAVGAAFLAEERVRFGIKWGDDNYAVGSIIAYGMNIVDAILSDEPIFPPAD